MTDAGASVKTFTVGFEGGGIETNEIPLARESAKLLGTQHSDRLIEQHDFQSGLERTIEILEEPISTSSALGFYEVSRLAQEEVPVLLSGQGADEPLAGYWRHVGEWLAMGPVRRSALRAAGSLLRAAPGRRSVRLRRGLESLRHARLPDRFLATYAMFGPEEKRLLYSPSVAAALTDVGDTAGPVEELRIRAAGRDSLQQMLYVDTRLWLPDDLLTVGDKTSMAASVEMRVPFLDRDLVEFVERLPSSYKLRHGRRKAIEKAAARKLLPRQILHRKERGFATPVGQWLRKPGFFEFTREALLDPSSTSPTLFDASRLELLLDEHRSRTADHGRQLYTLLALELWCRRFLGS
jgi:asparagine synthase (glutamine-hydrolysing)